MFERVCVRACVCAVRWKVCDLASFFSMFSAHVVTSETVNISSRQNTIYLCSANMGTFIDQEWLELV